MLDFTGLRLQDDTPIYQQLIRHVQLCVVAGSVQPGDELPSRRLLSAQLGVNPNTVQKAYRQLEEEGLLRSFAGSKSVPAVKGTLRIDGKDFAVYVALPAEKCNTPFQLLLPSQFCGGINESAGTAEKTAGQA